MKISIIIATYNVEEFLPRCLDSIRSQKYKDYELIIIDGQSTDNTIQVIKNNIDIISFWLSDKDNGVYDAWNKGLNYVTGDWICFIGADDFFFNENILLEVSGYLKRANDIGARIAYGQVLLVDTKKGTTKLKNKEWVKIKNNLRNFMPYIHSGSFHKKELFSKVGNFNSNFRIAGDFDLILRELQYNDAFFIDKTIICMEEGGLSTNPKYKRKVILEAIQAIRGNNIKRVPLRLYISYLLSYLK